MTFIEPITTPKPSPYDGWHIQRSGGYDQTGEWVSGNTWTCDLPIATSAIPVMQRSYGDNVMRPAHIWLSLSVWGPEKGGRVKPQRFTAKVRMGSVEEAIYGFGESRYCKSVSDALRRARKIDTAPAVERMLRKSYSAACSRCVYRIEDGAWNPWVSLLPIDTDSMLWPIGEYVEVWHGNDGKLLHSHIKRTWDGMSGGPASDAVKAACPPWITMHQRVFG